MATTTKPHGPEVDGHEAHSHNGHAVHGRELQHHYETPQQQKEAATLGMWVFLVTELMLFGGIFMAYTVYRWAFPDIWADAAHHLNTPLGTVNTVVLLVSSLTVALAVNAAEEGRQKRLVRLLAITMVLGVGFLGIKAYEYSEKFAHCQGYATPIAWATDGAPLGETECLVPGRAFVFPEHGSGGEQHAVTPGQSTPYQLFYLLYFIATGLHAVHMLIGLSIVGWLTFLGARGVFTTAYYTPVEIGGLYWHLIDIIWVFLFPLFYLVH